MLCRNGFNIITNSTKVFIKPTPKPPQSIVESKSLIPKIKNFDLQLEGNNISFVQKQDYIKHKISSGVLMSGNSYIDIIEADLRLTKIFNNRKTKDIIKLSKSEVIKFKY